MAAPIRKSSRLVTLALIWGGGALVALAILWTAATLAFLAYNVVTQGPPVTLLALVLNTLPIVVVGAPPALLGRAMWRAGRRRRGVEPLEATFN